MARSGLYKSDVQRARDSLRAEGKNPSVDAVRVALGNTGSKTTIHRYLKELEEEDGQGLGAKIAISDVLQDLVVRRPNGCMPRPKRWSPRSRRGSKPSCTSAPKPWNKPGKRPATSVRSFSAPRPCYRQSARRAKSPGRLGQPYHRTSTAGGAHCGPHSAVDGARKSRALLEQKHEHAREALEHYRTSVKDQREQEQRRHEHQVQELQVALRQANEALTSKTTTWCSSTGKTASGLPATPGWKASWCRRARPPTLSSASSMLCD